MKFNLIGHSAGGKVVAETALHMKNFGDSLNSITFLDAAIPSDSLSAGHRYAGIMNLTDNVTVCYSPNDSVLQKYYKAYRILAMNFLSLPAIGLTGAEGLDQATRDRINLSVNKVIGVDSETGEEIKLSDLQFEHSDYKNLPYDKVEQLYAALVNKIKGNTII